jgi:signal transduction histidine kinase
MNIEKLFEDKRTQFWALQLIGWTGWGVTFFMTASYWGFPGDAYYLYIPVICVVGMLLTLCMRVVYKLVWDLSPGRRIVIALATSFAAAAAWRIARVSYLGPLMLERDSQKMANVKAVLTTTWDHIFYNLQGVSQAWMVMLIWTTLYFGIKYYHLLQEERRRGLKSEAMAHEAQLKMLRYQLNPHFLFNTLNAISTLVLDKQNGLANTMVTRLSNFLRYSLDNDPMAKVSLAQEIEAMKLYLDIEKVRFAERLRLNFDIDKEAERALIPSLLLQPLAENAIKYAIAQSVNGGTIRISARVFAGELLLEVSDDGPGMDPAAQPKHKRNGVGLANTRERLRELYGNNQSFQLGKTEPHGLTINIRIPLEVDKQAVAA